MPDSEIQALTEDEAVQQIVETVQQADPGTAPFALVVGSGFSYGLVPTARELVETSLPVWMKSVRGGGSYAELSRLPEAERIAIARDFWKQFAEKNARRNVKLSLNAASGLPADYSAAYKAAFDSHFTGACGEPVQARKFQRALMRLDQPRLNAAHFLLASLLGVQPGVNRKSDLFSTAAAFSRLILTTNFDPFLQTALQAVNRLYFMSDTPELGVGDDVLDEQTDAIHLVYLHGSIHRRSQAASEADIARIKSKNASTLRPVLERHGVIVLGYSGWDDAIVEALAECDHFDHRLYWCGREADPLAKGAFGPRVPEILEKSTAVYVPIGSAGQFLARLYSQLVQGLPRLLENPIGQLREMLQTIDLAELKPVGAAGTHSGATNVGSPGSDVFVEKQKAAIERLARAEQIFLSPALPAERAAAAGADPQAPDAASASSAGSAKDLLSSARMASALGKYSQSLELCTQALALNTITAGERADALMERGLDYYFTGDAEHARADWTALIDLPGAPVAQVALALLNRGVTWGEMGDTDKALADYTRLIEQLPGVPVDFLAMGLVNRGATWRQVGAVDKELADYTKVIEQLPDAPVEQVAMALVNRGVALQMKDGLESALADYTRVIEQLPGAPAEQVAKALVNRSVVWEKKGDTAGEMADSTRVIEQVQGAPAEQVARAFASRGWAHYLRGEYSAFLADTQSAVAKFPALAHAAFNLGLALMASNRDSEALAAYERAAAQAPLEIEKLGLLDLADAQKTWLSAERAAPIVQLLKGRQTQKSATA